MRILIDIGHPGHVHLFRPFAKAMLEKGHAVLFTCREKEFEIELLKSAGFDFISFGKKFKSTIGKVLGLIKFDFLEIKAALKFKPDIFLSHGSPYAAHAAFFLRKINIALEDTGNKEQVRIYMPFTKAVLTGESFQGNYGNKQIKYKGFHELAYLHPNRFQPNAEILKELGLKEGDVFFILRFISWDASHDVGEKGLTSEEKLDIVKFLNKLGRVIISSEKKLPAELETYAYNLHPSKIHDLMSFATLFIGEGATMASECAIIGTPSVYINSMEAGTIDEQEKYGLVYHFRNGFGVLEKIKELVNDINLKKNAKLNSNKLIKDNIDVAAFLVWFIENYPQSEKIMKNNPDHQNKFK